MPDDIKDIADQMLADQPHKVCPKCNHSWVLQAVFCGYCGTKLSDIGDSNGSTTKEGV